MLIGAFCCCWPPLSHYHSGAPDENVEMVLFQTVVGCRTIKMVERCQGPTKTRSLREPPAGSFTPCKQFTPTMMIFLSFILLHFHFFDALPPVSINTHLQKLEYINMLQYGLIRGSRSVYLCTQVQKEIAAPEDSKEFFRTLDVLPMTKVN